MHTAVRPYATAGVALVGASVIAVSPLAPPLPDIHIASPLAHVAASVELAAFVNPITEWVNVIGATVANLGGLGQEIVANPAPILTQFLTNQLGYAQTLGTAAGQTVTSIVSSLSDLPTVLSTAFGFLATGDVFDAINTLWSYAVFDLLLLPALPLLESVITVAEDITANINSVVVNGIVDSGALLIAALSLFVPANSALAQFAFTAQDIVTAAGSGDFVTVLSDIINLPAFVTGAFLNGTPTDLGFPLVSTAGLLTNPTNPASNNTIGTIEALLQLRESIAVSIGATPPADTPAQSLTPAAPNVSPKLAANTVTVNAKQTQAPAPTTTAPTVGSGPAAKVLTPVNTTPTTTAPNTATASGGLATAVKATGNEVGSTLSKIGAGLAGGSGHVPKHAK